MGLAELSPSLPRRVATVLPDLDFETYSEAGFVWHEDVGKWRKPPNVSSQKKPGLPVVGAANYARHPTTEILSLAYDLKDGRGHRHWKPGDAPPQELFDYIASGGLLEAWNSAFEVWIWECVAVPKLGWPPLPRVQIRCAMAKARAFAWPGKLDDAGRVAAIVHQKDPDGSRLLNKFSVPQSPTKKQPNKRIRPEDDPEDAKRLYAYNIRDITAESEISAITPDLIPSEQEFWRCDQDINHRGVGLDVRGMEACITIVEQAFVKYNAELRQITGGVVDTASQIPSLKAWAATRGVHIPNLTEDDLDLLLKRKDLPPDVYRALEIRGTIGSASIKKLYAMRYQQSEGTLYDLFNFHAARTGRATGAEVQPHNLPKDGPNLYRCLNQMCAHWFGSHTFLCPWCGHINPPSIQLRDWNPSAISDAFEILHCGSLELCELYFGNAILLVMGCIRGLFIARTGHDLIASDYSAIEGVVTAALAGERWRLEVFAKGEDIYLHAASGITGIPYANYVAHKANTQQHHPHRQPFGKIAELSSGFGGGLGAWKAFGADEYFTDDEIKANVKKWRKQSPAIVQMWGGQERFNPEWGAWETSYFGLEGAAICAVMNPGMMYSFRAQHHLAASVSFICEDKKLYCVLPSGRVLTYHNPFLSKGTKFSENGFTLYFEGWNTNPKMGSYGWVRMSTYGGKLTENVVQAVARDILAYAIVKLEFIGYPVVLHVHDEIVAEVPKGVGSVEQLEAVMNDLPPWCAGWPLKAKGGWRGYRYRKD